MALHRDIGHVSTHGRSGDVLLSRGLSQSTIGAEGFHFRVRDGIGCFILRYDHQIIDAWGESALLQRCVVALAENDESDARGFYLRTQREGDNKADRAFSTGKLRVSPRFHTRPINVVVYHGSRRDLVLREASHLDAFSGYPFRT